MITTGWTEGSASPNPVGIYLLNIASFTIKRKRHIATWRAFLPPCEQTILNGPLYTVSLMGTATGARGGRLIVEKNPDVLTAL